MSIDYYNHALGPDRRWQAASGRLGTEISGRKVASASLVVRGAVRIVAAVATRLRVVGGEELAPQRLADWQKQRAELGRRKHARVRQHRFRRDPKAYLRNLERQYRLLSLPT
jgi:hypothetical protein